MTAKFAGTNEMKGGVHADGEAVSRPNGSGGTDAVPQSSKFSVVLARIVDAAAAVQAQIGRKVKVSSDETPGRQCRWASRLK